MNNDDRLALLRQRVEEYNRQSPNGKGGAARAARELGYSDGAVSNALAGKYGASLNTLLAKVEEVYGNTSVDCPALGTITLAQCGQHSRRPFAATNPLRVQMFRACAACPHKGGTR